MLSRHAQSSIAEQFHRNKCRSLLHEVLNSSRSEIPTIASYLTTRSVVLLSWRNHKEKVNFFISIWLIQSQMFNDSVALFLLSVTFFCATPTKKNILKKICERAISSYIFLSLLATIFQTKLQMNCKNCIISMKWKKKCWCKFLCRFVVVYSLKEVKNVNGLLKCHYFMSRNDLFIDYWLLSFASLIERVKMHELERE